MYTKESFQKTVAPKLKEVLKVKNANAVPVLKKIVISAGIGSLAVANKNIVNDVAENISAIAGQKAVITKSRKAISNFKLRENMPVGVTVTLRGQAMYNFLNKFINIVCPRIRDFRGFTVKSLDGYGNLCIGIKEHTVFPEINQEDLSGIHGLQINIETSAKNNEQALELFKTFNFPFRELKETNKK